MDPRIRPGLATLSQARFTPVLHKHTSRLDLADLLSVGVDEMQRNFEPLKHQIDSWKTGTLIDHQAKVIIYEAFVEQRLPMRLLPSVHQNYFQPAYDAFAPRTLWSLSNAVCCATIFFGADLRAGCRLGYSFVERMKTDRMEGR